MKKDKKYDGLIPVPDKTTPVNILNKNLDFRVILPLSKRIKIPRAKGMPAVKDKFVTFTFSQVLKR